MGILNTASDGLPNILVVLYDLVVRARRRIPRQKLIERVAPQAISSDGGQKATQTLVRWIELGLFEESDEGVTLAETGKAVPRSDAELISQVRVLARDCVLSKRNNPDLWAQESARAADFSRSMAWVLAQDVYRPLYSDLESLEMQQMSEGTPPLMRNDTRRNGLRIWGTFLGFVRPYFEVDPTVAVRDNIPQLLRAKEGIPVSDFISSLALKLPIIDGGAWRLDVERHMSADAMPALGERQLSTSLSRALINLMRSQEIVLENRADVGTGVVLTGRDGVRNDMWFTWIRPGAGEGV